MIIEPIIAPATNMPLRGPGSATGASEPPGTVTSIGPGLLDWIHAGNGEHGGFGGPLAHADPMIWGVTATIMIALRARPLPRVLSNVRIGLHPSVAPN